jgi:hypothetical protein
MAKGERLDKSGDKDFVKWVDKPDGTSHIYYGEKGGKGHGHVVLNPPGSGRAVSYERDKSGHAIRWSEKSSSSGSSSSSSGSK